MNLKETLKYWEDQKQSKASKGDKKLRSAAYITLAIVAFVVVTLAIKPAILLYTVLIGISICLIGLVFGLVYAILDRDDW
jgi:archaellum biogenesis protein FlaJ (TadC family)